MNYSRHYSLLINRAVGRTLEGYTEKHHILPRCMGGSDEPENLVRLTAREHFVAHQLLVKMYPEERNLIFAAHAMTCDPLGGRVGNRKYGWLRERHASRISELRVDYFNNSPGARVAYSTRQKQRLNNDPEYKARMLAGSGQPEVRKRAGESLRRTLATPEGKAKMKAAAIERGSRPEQKQLRVDLLKARHAAGDPSLEKGRINSRSAEAVAKRVAKYHTTVNTVEGKERLSAAAKKRWETRDRKVVGQMLKASRAGKENGRSRPVVQLFPNGFVVAEFPNMKAAALANGHDKHTIYDRVKRGHPLWVGV